MERDLKTGYETGYEMQMAEGCARNLTVFDRISRFMARTDIKRLTPRGLLSARKQTLANWNSVATLFRSGYRSEADIARRLRQCLLVTLTGHLSHREPELHDHTESPALRAPSIICSKSSFRRRTYVCSKCRRQAFGSSPGNGFNSSRARSRKVFMLLRASESCPR